MKLTLQDFVIDVAFVTAKLECETLSLQRSMLKNESLNKDFFQCFARIRAYIQSKRASKLCLLNKTTSGEGRLFKSYELRR